MFTLWSIFKAGLLVANAGVIPHKQRFLAKCAARASFAHAIGRAHIAVSCVDGWDEPDAAGGASIKNQVGENAVCVCVCVCVCNAPIPH